MSSADAHDLVLPPALSPLGRADRRALRRRRVLMVSVLLLVVLPPMLWVWLARGTAPADGTLTYASDHPWSATSGVAVERIHAGGQLTDENARDGVCPLAKGDRVVAVADKPLDALVRGSVTMAPLEVGGEVTYTVHKPDHEAGEDCLFTVTLTAWRWGAFLSEYFTVLPLAVVMWLIAAFVFLQRPRDSAARALFAAAVLLPFGVTAWPLGTQVIDLANGPRLWPFLWGDLANTLLWGALLHFAAVFPRAVPWIRGHPRRVLAIYALPFALHLVDVVLNGFAPALGDWFGYFVPGANSGLGLDALRYLTPLSLEAGRTVPFVVAGTIAWQYWRNADDDERRRMRWVNYTLIFCAFFYLAFAQIPTKLIDRPLVDWAWLPIVFVVVPIALCAAILRYGIFDLQIILRRSLVYGVLTAVLVVVPAAVTVAVGHLVGADPPALVLALSVALVVAIFYQALRTRLKRRISRLIFGDRDDPYQVISQLGSRLQSNVPAELVLASIAETVAHALRLPYVAVELVGPDEVTDTESYGERQGEVLTIPLVNQGEVVGSLLLDPGTGREPFGPADRKLVELLAQQVGIAAQNVLLSGRLQRSLQRAVVAREEERRRLRRDIHDGLGPLLAATRMRLQVAHSLMLKDPDAATAILRELIDTQQAVLNDVRRLVEGLRPPVLDQLGLVSAVRERAITFSARNDDDSGLHITVDAADEVEPLPAAVEVAAYRIVLEALTNVTRHAEATQCHVTMRRAGALLIEVEDDGRGMPTVYHAGVGLTSMRERATELGGSCAVSPGTYGGTVVRARLPIHSP